MTYVRFVFNPTDIGFYKPINEEFVVSAAHYIRSNLESVARDHDDYETRLHDDRRTHDPMVTGSWLIKYVKNQLIITNTIANPVHQMEALKSGNGSGLICAKHINTKPRLLKGWSEKDRHWPRSKGGRKTVAGELGMPYPPMLKFYSKRDGMWKYRQCVKPISSEIVLDFNLAIERAVLDGLEEAYYEARDYGEYEDTGTNEPLDESPYEYTLEEMTKSNESAITTNHKDTEYQQIKLEEEKHINDEHTEKVHQKMGVVQTLSLGIDKSVQKAKSFLGRFGL